MIKICSALILRSKMNFFRKISFSAYMYQGGEFINISIIFIKTELDFIFFLTKQEIGQSSK
jgi:hypothetical protein